MSRTQLLDPAVARATAALSATAKKELGDPALAELVDAWEEAEGLYSERERAARHFTEDELAHLIGLITVINGWNRLMVSRRVQPGGYQP